jgi:hypothetical protein
MKIMAIIIGSRSSSQRQQQEFLRLLLLLFTVAQSKWNFASSVRTILAACE